jgi:predicted dienelactone hydrolase
MDTMIGLMTRQLRMTCLGVAFVASVQTAPYPWVRRASPLHAMAPRGAIACTTSVGYRVMHIHGRVVAVWYPTSAAPAVYAYGPNFSGLVAHDGAPSTACRHSVPLVVFSHGDLGCGLQSVVFTEELARSGYVVAAPDHADAALCHTVAPAPVQSAAMPAQPAILRPQDWDEHSRRDRRDDIEGVINTLLVDPVFAGVIDADRIGLAGHSLGGYTVMAMVGGWASWTDPRIRAVLALSPYVMPFQVKQTLGNVHVPVMYQGGTADVGITPFLQGPKGAYAMANSPAYFVVLRRAGHFAWVNCDKEHTTQACIDNVADMRLITVYGIAFFDKYLKGLDQPLLARRSAAVAFYGYK